MSALSVASLPNFLSLPPKASSSRLNLCLSQNPSTHRMVPPAVELDHRESLVARDAGVTRVSPSSCLPRGTLSATPSEEPHCPERRGTDTFVTGQGAESSAAPEGGAWLCGCCWLWPQQVLSRRGWGWGHRPPEILTCQWPWARPVISPLEDSPLFPLLTKTCYHRATL